MVIAGPLDPFEFRFYTGAVATDFVATVGRRRAGGVDRLTVPGRLVDWLSSATLCPPGILASEAQLRRSRQLRESVYRLLLARVGERTVERTDLETVNGWARRRPPVSQLAHRGGAFTLRLAAGSDPIGSGLAAVASDAVRLLTDERANTLRACQAADCGLLYLDHSQTRNRRWCSMRECGNRMKAATFRARRTGATT